MAVSQILHQARVPEEVFFVKIERPNELRKSLLESLKDIVENLQSFEKFTAVREEKLVNIEKLRDDIKGLVKLNSALKSVMPATKLTFAAEKKEKVGKQGEEMPVKETRHLKPRSMSELEKLETELSKIESRLSSLR